VIMSMVFKQTSFRSVTICVTGEWWINMQLELNERENYRVTLYLKTQHKKTVFIHPLLALGPVVFSSCPHWALEPQL
jgi:hypothetical protein